ncbi:MAG: hypothetical protein NVSMB26_28660 [Beijerinckiaceae bacterium]
MVAQGPLVVKLGGSLAQGRQFAPWIEAIRSCRSGAIIVPGGGPFAATVRETQRDMRFDDAAAHRMALLAMEQYAIACRSSFPDMLLLGDEARLQAIALGQVAFWLPSRMVLAATDLPHSWHVTSDTLAAWLAARLKAQALIIVKSVDVMHEKTQADALASHKIVDPLFPRFAARTQAAIRLAGPADLADAAAIFAADGLPGVPVLADA